MPLVDSAISFLQDKLLPDGNCSWGFSFSLSRYPWAHFSPAFAQLYNVPHYALSRIGFQRVAPSCWPARSILSHCGFSVYFPNTVCSLTVLPTCLAHFLSSLPVCSLDLSLPKDCLLWEGQRAWVRRGMGIPLFLCLQDLSPLPSLLCFVGFFLWFSGFFFLSPGPIFVLGFSFPSFCSLFGGLMGNAENVIMLNIDSCILKIKTEGKWQEEIVGIYTYLLVWLSLLSYCFVFCSEWTL